MAVRISKGRALDLLNMTPLIDVVFLLLIFFLVATRFAQEDRELPVQLPSATNALPMTVEPNELVINIDADGAYHIRGARMGLNELEGVVRDAMADNPMNQVIVIRGDRSVSLQSAVSVIDLCTKFKASYKLSTKPETSE